jgi:hypothetical protein
MAYASENFKSKKAFKEAVASGKEVTLYSPGLGGPYNGRTVCVEGPWYPAPHSWYATATCDANGKVVKVK